MKRLLLQSNARQNVEFSPRYGSPQRVDADAYGHEGVYGQEDSVGSATPTFEVRREKEATILQKKTEGALLQKKVAAFTQDYNVQSPFTQEYNVQSPLLNMRCCKRGQLPFPKRRRQQCNKIRM